MTTPTIINKSVRGKYNSSITRVRPLFSKLLQDNISIVSWLPTLLRLAKCNQAYAEQLAQNPGKLKPTSLVQRAYKDRTLIHYGIKSVRLEHCFEKTIPPPTPFLKWLIQHPEEMNWPNYGKRKYGKVTQHYREQLMGKYGANVQASAKCRALNELAKCSASRSGKRWWAFEGFTEADLCWKLINFW